MSQVIAPPKNQEFLPFRPLAIVAAAVNIPAFAGLLLIGHLWSAFSVLAGLGLGMAVYGSLHLFVGRGLEPFLPAVRGRSKPATGGMTFFFALLLPLKYLALGGLMWLLWRSGHLSLVWLAAGFVTTQVAVTAAAVRQMLRAPKTVKGE